MNIQSLILAICTLCATPTPAAATHVAECYDSKQEFRLAHPAEHMYHTDRLGPKRCYHVGGKSPLHGKSLQASKPLQEKVGNTFSKKREMKPKPLPYPGMAPVETRKNLEINDIYNIFIWGG